MTSADPGLAGLLARPTTILVIDMQRDYCVPSGIIGALGYDTAHFAGVAERLDHFLAASAPTLPHRVFVRTVAPPWPRPRALSDHYARSRLNRVVTPDLADWFRVQPGPGDDVVDKFRYSAFADTCLESLLRARGTETLVVAGVTTEVCVDTTVRHAFLRDFGVVVLSDCTGASTPERQVNALSVLDCFFARVASSQQVLAALPR